MKAIAAILLGLGSISLGFSQTSPESLGQARAVDVAAQVIEWNPSGDCLAYKTDEDSKLGIGLYQVGSARGSVLLHVAKNATWNLQWFRGQFAGIVTVTTATKTDHRVAAYLLEANPPSVKKLIEVVGDAGEAVDMSADLSPLLEHAIFRIHKGDTTSHMVMPAGGGELIPSTDVDQAEKQGLAGPTWAATGTAFYVPPPKLKISLSGSGSDGSGGAVFVLGAPDKTQGSQANQGSAIEMSLTLDAVLAAALSSAPDEGKVGLELMPDLAILRQVRSPGAWTEPEQAPISIGSQAYPADVVAGPMAGKSQSLWLVAKDKSWSHLVAPAADSSSLSPTGHAIAYTLDGALFVRQIAY